MASVLNCLLESIIFYVPSAIFSLKPLSSIFLVISAPKFIVYDPNSLALSIILSKMSVLLYYVSGFFIEVCLRSLLSSVINGSPLKRIVAASGIFSSSFSSSMTIIPLYFFLNSTNGDCPSLFGITGIISFLPSSNVGRSAKEVKSKDLPSFEMPYSASYFSF